MGVPIRGAPLAALLMVFAFGPVWNAPPEDEGSGAETCAACHEEQVQSFQRTSHAAARGLKAEELCESCHGPGQAHVDDGDPAKIVQLGALSPREASEVCLSCHKEQHRSFSFGQSTHSLNQVSCVDCHNPHLTSEKMLRNTGIALCATCHESIVGQFRLPRSHPLSESSEGCASCHEPHGTKNHRMLRSAGGEEVCVKCHIDKAGPFLYEHDIGSVDGCRACHRVHGTPNRHLLAHSRAINLCYQCHVATATPTFHNAIEFRNEKCSACHTAIHGSNTHPFFLEE